MRIGMATTVPTTDEQKAELRKLAYQLEQTAAQARRVTDSFGRTDAAITVEGRDMEALLGCLSEQVYGVWEKA